jgi:hypothetical protein
MSHRATIGNLGKDGIPQEVRDEFTAIPVERIEEVYQQPSIRTFPQSHRLN